MKPLAGLACLVLLTGCSAAAPAAVTTSTPSTVAPWTPTETYRTPTAKPATFTIRCSGVTFSDFREAWTRAAELDLSRCEATLVSGTAYTLEQAAAARAAGYADVTSVRTLYGLCAQVEGYYTEPKTALSEGQIKEINGIFALCPDAPQIQAIRDNIAYSATIAQEEADGVRFGDGTYRVGTEVQPGTYAVEDGKNCYWERLDRRGEIIANNFVTANTRVEVTIKSTDYSFHSEGCGEWSRA